MLKHHGRLACQVSTRVPCHEVDAPHLQRAAVRPGQSVHAAQQRRLAGTRQAEHHDELARLHIEIDSVQDLIAAEAFAQLARVDHFIRPRSSFNDLAVCRTTS